MKARVVDWRVFRDEITENWKAERKQRMGYEPTLEDVRVFQSNLNGFVRLMRKTCFVGAREIVGSKVPEPNTHRVEGIYGDEYRIFGPLVDCSRHGAKIQAIYAIRMVTGFSLKAAVEFLSCGTLIVDWRRLEEMRGLGGSLVRWNEEMAT